MILYSLRTKVLTLVGVGLLLATVGIATIAHNGIRDIIDRSQTAVYQGELDHLLLTLTQYHDELKKTLQVDVYRDQFQEEALRIIRLNFLAETGDNVYPFILNHEGQVILHPKLPFGDKSLINLDFIQSSLDTSKGSFKYRYLGEDKWLIYAKFEPWNWVAGYTLKQSYMYADLMRFQQTLLPVLVGLLLIVATVLLYGLQRFLKPVIELTKSADAIAKGDLEQPITADGEDEVAVLARNFESMRTAVRQTIMSLDMQRNELQKEVEERKRAEEELVVYQDKLELLVEDRTHQLKEAHSALIQSERLATLGKLTATVSHELRNPLGTIQSALFSIEESIERNEPHQSARSLELAERSIHRCVRIIEDLNNYTRVKELDLSKAFVDDWLKTVLEEQSIPEEISFNLNLASGVEASFDQEKMRQVVVNLITNAIHALQDKKSERKSLRISTRHLAENYEILFEDSGIGMSDETKEKVFEPLYSTKGFGVGFGMVIVKNIVKQHYGEINIESEEGEGTTVSLRLPINISKDGKVS
jgi:signal transduction histidine kinase